MRPCRNCLRHAAYIKCMLNVLVMFLIPGYELDMARSSSALRRPPAAPSVPVGGFARRGPPGSAQVPPAAVDLGQPPDAEVAVDADRRRGRGAQSNASGRYEPLARVVFDDGWRRLEDLPPFKTTVAIDTARRIITRNDSPDISFDRSINPYRGRSEERRVGNECRSGMTAYEMPK